MRASRYIAAASVIQQLASAFTLYLITRTLGAGGYGKLAALMAVANSAVSLGSAGLSVYLLQEGTRRSIEREKLGRLFPITLAIGTVTSVAILVGLVLKNAANIALPDATIWAVSFALFTGMLGLTYLRFGYQASEAFRQYSLALAADRWLHCGIVCGLSISGMLTIRSVVVSQCVSMGIVAIVGLGHLFRRHIDLSVRDFAARRLIRISAPNAATTFVNYFSSSAFLILTLKGMASAEVVGRAALAFRISGLLQMPARWVMPTVLPFFMRQAATVGGEPELRSALKSVVVPILLWGCVTCAFTGVVLLSTRLMTAVFGASYEGSDRWIVLILATTSGEITNSVLVKALWSLGKNRRVFLSNVLCGPIVLAAALLSDSYLFIFGVLVVTVWLRAALQLWFLKSLQVSISVPLLIAIVSSVAAALCIVAGWSDAVLTWVLTAEFSCCLLFMLLFDRTSLAQPFRTTKEVFFGHREDQGGRGEIS